MTNSERKAWKTTAKEVVGESKDGRKITCIVCDDEFSHRHLMAQILRSIGFDVLIEAENGADAIEYYQKLKPRFLVLDMNMPRVNGLDVLKLVKKVDPTALVIMCTSMDDKETVTSLLKAGAVEYIVKPIDRPLVIEKVQRFVQRFDLRK